jgi:transcriptional regulator with XRE-family HTH domain
MTRRKRDTFGARLRQLREDADFTQDQLIDRLAAVGVRIGRSYISELERTDKLPNGEVIIGLARALRCSADYLLGLSDVAELPTDAAGVYGISPEADEVARIIDALPPETRAFVVHMARSLAAYMAGQAQGQPPGDVERIAPGVAGRWVFGLVRREPEGAD